MNNLATIMKKVDVCQHGLSCIECCWPWLAAESKGYPNVSYKAKQRNAVRVIFCLVKHIPLEEKFQACHTCDNKICCNWSHIYKGTHISNMQDRKERNGNAVGEAYPQAKLNRYQVYQLRRLYHAGYGGCPTLAKLFHITQPIAWRIVTRRDWSHLKGELCR